MQADKNPAKPPNSGKSWRRVFGATKGPTAASAQASLGRESWRRMAESNVGHIATIDRLAFRRMGLTLLVILLFLSLLWVLFSIKHRAPLIVGFASIYPVPFNPVEFAQEDRDLLRRLSVSGRVFRPASITWHDATDHVQTATAHDIAQHLATMAGRAKAGGPENDMIFVYLTMTGTLDGKGRPCLIPPSAVDTTAGDASGYLGVDHLLKTLRAAVKPDTGIVLVLDSCRALMNWPMGVGDGGFAPAVEALMADMNLKRTWVLLSAQAGQLAHDNPASGHTAFARMFAMGLRGAADDAPFGNRNGRIELGELAAYLAEEVDRSVMALCGARQTPLLVPAMEAGAGADNPQVAWVVSRTPAEQLGLTGRSTATGMKAKNTRLALESDGPDWWLRERWTRAKRLRNIGIHERPYHWENYLQHLLLAETLRAAGAAFTDELIRVETLVERFELRLESIYFGSAEQLPSLRLRRLARLQMDLQPDPAMTAWRDKVADYVSKPPAPNSAPLTAPVVASSREWLDKAAVAWDWLTEQIDAGVAIDRGMLSRWLEIIGPRPANLPVNTNNVQIARMMVRWLDPAVWETHPRLPGQILLVLGMSREAAMPRDVRADKIVDAVAPRTAMDAKLREAIDLLFLADPASLQRSEELAATCKVAYAEINTIAEETSQSFRLSDVLHDELPWLAAWYVHEKRVIAAAGDQADHRGPQFFQTFSWSPLVEALQRFDTTLFERLTALGSKNSPLTAAELMTLLSENRNRVEQHYKALRTAYDTSCEELAALAPDTPATLAGIWRVLVTPLVMGDLRMQLIERAERLVRRFGEADDRATNEQRPPLPQPAPQAAVAGWMPWRETLIHPLIPLLGRDLPGATTSPTQSRQVAVAIGQQLTDIREAVRTLPEELSRLAELQIAIDASAEANDDVSLDYLRRSEHTARRLSPVICPQQFFTEVTPIQKSLMAAWHDRLVSIASSTLDDYWAGVEPGDPVWAFEASRLLLQKAVDLIRDVKINHGYVKRRSVEERLMMLEANANTFGKVSFSPTSVLMFPTPFRDDAPDNRTQLTPEREVPAGIASMWLAESMHSNPLPILRGAGMNTVSRLPLQVPPGGGTSTTAWRLDTVSDRLLASRGNGALSSASVLDMVIWYRGHRIVTGLPLETAATIRTMEWRAADPAAPRVTVRGDLPRNQSVSIVFDCSGSMGERLIDGRTRLESGREALYDLLDIIAKDGGWSASLWLYGHRTKWSRDARGRYTADLTDAGKRERDKTVADGRQFSLVPGNDVEQVMEMQPLSPVQVLRIRSILDAQEPGGETPLYRAINEALRVDCGGPNPGPAHVLAVTDGANDQSGGTIVTSSDVLRTLSRVNFKRPRQDEVRVDVIGFNMMAGRFDRELRMQELQSLAADSGGRYFDATDPGKLAASLRNSLRIVRWGVEGGHASRDLVELDEAISLPRPVQGRVDTYDVKLESGTTASKRRISVSGDEGLQLFVAGGGRTLEFRRYDGGTEQGLRDSVSDLPDPLDPSRRCFIGAHMAVRNGTSMNFPVSIQNGDAEGFSPRPVEAWVEVQPRSATAAVGLPYVFYDLSWQPFRPAPVLNLNATNWPIEATAAQIRCWFRFRPAEPELAIALQDLLPGVERRFQLKCLPGSSIRALVSRNDTTPRVLRLTVIEEHPQPTAKNLPLLRVAVSPDCLRAVHILEPGTGRMRHEFEVLMIDGQLSADVRLLVSDRQAILKGAVGSLAPQGAAETLTVPVPVK